MKVLSLILGALSVIAAVCFGAASAQYPIPKDTMIVMQRGNCEGGCPVYRVVIFGNGDVIWQGIARVSRTGVVLNHIEPDAVRSLIDEFRSIDYLHLENIYDFRGKGCESNKPDMPIVTTYFAMNGESKTLMHHDGCVGEVPQRLSALEDKIDSVVKTAAWISGHPPASKHK